MDNNKTTVKVFDRHFRHYITHDEIQQTLSSMADKINHEYSNKKPLFIIVLNGAFMFAADLLKKITIDCEINFVRVSSYQGMESTHTINELIGLDRDIKDRNVIIVEDIVDTGITMEYILQDIKNRNVSSVRVATLLFKKGKFEKTFPIDYIGFSIPNDFVVGYGLDYEGFGRNLRDIYSVIEE
jgi:hypoxanthine phosphoribosyltransferase